jgi:glycerol-3-phosphate responsive antiterminator
MFLNDRMMDVLLQYDYYIQIFLTYNFSDFQNSVIILKKNEKTVFILNNLTYLISFDAGSPKWKWL